MKKISKKEIRKFIEVAITKVLLRFKTSVTSKKGKKLLDAFSRKYATEVRKSIKKSMSEAPANKALKRKAPKRTSVRKPIKKGE